MSAKVDVDDGSGAVIPLYDPFVEDIVATIGGIRYAEPERLVDIGGALRLEGDVLVTRAIVARDPERAIYVHYWRRSDPSDFHCHPWDFVALVLRVGYWEVTPAGRFWRPPGSVIFHKAEDMHRIELEADDEVTGGFLPVSLVIAGKNRRRWGFHTPQGFVDAEEYRG